MKQYCIFDITKLILILMVVIIHAGILPFIVYPWARIAVPLFFVISSFLFFSKMNNLKNKEETNLILKKFVTRNLKLYLFWFIILLPITVLHRWCWFDSGLLIGIIRVFKNTIFSSTFAASWFIMALIWSVVIIYNCCNQKNNKFITFLTAIIYLLCCLKSSYFSLFSDCHILKQIYTCYEFFFSSPIFSFPAALFWVMLGKLYAENKIIIQNKLYYVLIAIVSLIMLYIEWRYIYALNGTYSNDCYIFLMPLAFAIFGIIKNIDVEIKNSIVLRKISTIIYCSHFSVILTIRFLIIKVFHLVLTNSQICWITFIITLIICSFTCYIILKLEDKKRFSILKYSY